MPVCVVPYVYLQFNSLFLQYRSFTLTFYATLTVLQGSVIVIGAGVAGLAAALQLERAGCQVSTILIKASHRKK